MQQLQIHSALSHSFLDICLPITTQRMHNILAEKESVNTHTHTEETTEHYMHMTFVITKYEIWKKQAVTVLLLIKLLKEN